MLSTIRGAVSTIKHQPLISTAFHLTFCIRSFCVPGHRLAHMSTLLSLSCACILCEKDAVHVLSHQMPYWEPELYKSAHTDAIKDLGMNKSMLKSMPRNELQLLLGTPSYQALWYRLMKPRCVYESAECSAEITGAWICKPGLSWPQRRQHKLHEKLPHSAKSYTQFKLRSFSI